MNEHNHAVVWIDHREAKVFHFSPEDVRKLVVHPNDRHVHIHHKANTLGSGHAREDHNFLTAVIEAIGGAHAVLIVGPGREKTELMKHIAQHAPRQLSSVLGVVTVDHPTDGQLVAHARKYFLMADRTTPQVASGDKS